MRNVWRATRTDILKQGGPKAFLLSKHNIDKTSSQANWYHAFIPNEKKRNKPIYFGTDDQTTWTNIKAILANIGQKKNLYPTFVSFTYKDIEQHITLYMLQGIASAPHQHFRLEYHGTDPGHGNDFVWQHMGHNLSHCNRNFKCFFTNKYPYLTKPPRKACPNFKLLPFLIDLSQVIQEAWEFGNNTYVDEQTIGFQGQYSDKLWINFRNTSDVFQADCLCEDGYTFSFQFLKNRHNNSGLTKYSLCFMTVLLA